MELQQLIGIGLRENHYQQILEDLPQIGWFEVHSENFFNSDEILKNIRQHYPISLHGIGLSLGSIITQDHLIKLKNLIDKIEPFLVSEHLSWGRVGNHYIPDLLPIAYNQASLNNFIDNVNKTQDFLQREILIENPSSYLEYKASDIDEVSFLVEICQRTGAKILLDVNNVFVSCSNHNWYAVSYISQIPKDLVKEIHLAGHSHSASGLLIDSHDNIVCQEVWQLYDVAIKRFGAIFTLLEWDKFIPSYQDLITQANKALVFLEANLHAK